MRFLGLDLGTQSLKAVVCDEHLAVLGQHSVGYPVSRPAPDCAEQDPRAWEAALAPAIGGALAAAACRPDAIAAIAISGQLDGCVAIGADGAAVHPALIWQDRRASEQAKRVAAADVFATTGQVADASHMAPKIAWLREHGVKAARFHQPVSYLVSRLTGEHVMDPSLASTTMLLDLSTARWAPQLLDAYALTWTDLPAIADACSVAGTLTDAGAALTGLVAGTPVAVGTGDDFTNVLGAGVTRPGTIVCAIGTAEVVGTISNDLVLDRLHREPLVETHLFPGGGYFVEHPGWLAGGALRWTVQLLGLAGDAELDALAATIAAGADGLTFIPALAGAMVPVWRPHARATLHGLTTAHTNAHVARAVLEGLSFSTYEVVSRLHSMLALAGQDVLLVGGGSRSRLWNQLRADLLGRVHRVAVNVDTSPIGAAMIAAVAAGAHANLGAAAALLPPPVETFSPVPTPALHDALVEYKKLVARLVVSGDV